MRGRKMNPLRDAARQVGEKFFADAKPCDFCGTNKRYVSNSACVSCAIAAGNARYAALDQTDKDAIAVRDKARYLAKKAEAL